MSEQTIRVMEVVEVSPSGSLGEVRFHCILPASAKDATDVLAMVYPDMDMTAALIANQRTTTRVPRCLRDDI